MKIYKVDIDDDLLEYLQKNEDDEVKMYFDKPD